MAKYEYKCRHCHCRFSKSVKIEERNQPQMCPSCGKTDSEKVLSNIAFNKTNFQDSADCESCVEDSGQAGCHGDGCACCSN
ncbi:MAG: zinc ribbon domain-containing protein [Candidatus Margulisbacteria bacterium]|nr:zinc ribbon domain-containing protein [Candidatus Margulisiibacteriota bacterium]